MLAIRLLNASEMIGADKYQCPCSSTTRYNEQTAIANFLDRKTAEIDALIAQKERLLELYEEEKTAHYQPRRHQRPRPQRRTQRQRG